MAGNVKGEVKSPGKNGLGPGRKRRTNIGPPPSKPVPNTPKPGKPRYPDGTVLNPGEGSAKYGKRIRSESPKTRKVAGGKVML